MPTTAPWRSGCSPRSRGWTSRGSSSGSACGSCRCRASPRRRELDERIVGVVVDRLHQRGLVRAIDADPARVLITPAGRRTAGAATLPPTPPTPDAGRFVFLRPAAPVGNGPARPGGDRDEEVCDFHPQRRRKGTMDPGEHCDGSGWIVDAGLPREPCLPLPPAAHPAQPRPPPRRPRDDRDAELRPRLVAAPRAPSGADAGGAPLDARHRRASARRARAVDDRRAVGPPGAGRRERRARRGRPAAADPGGVRAGRPRVRAGCWTPTRSRARRAPSAARAPAAS